MTREINKNKVEKDHRAHLLNVKTRFSVRI